MSSMQTLHNLFADIPDSQTMRRIHDRLAQNILDIQEGNPYHIKLTDVPKEIREKLNQMFTELEKIHE